MKTMFVYRQDTETTPPPASPRRASLPCMKCSPPCKYLRSSRPHQGGSKTVQLSPLTTWNSAVLGALRVAPPWDVERRQNARRSADPGIEGLATLISRSRSPRRSRTHPRACSSSLGLGWDKNPLSPPHEPTRGRAASGGAEFSQPAPGSPPRSCTARLLRLLRGPPCPEPKPDRLALHEAGRQLELREA